MGDFTDSPATRNPPRTMPVRDDCWSQDATFTLIEAWGRNYIDLNKGNLRQKHWQEVSDAVNGAHAGFDEKARRTDIQCKNRIDTLKKKYKTEKARVLDSNGSYQSNWPFFFPLDSLIGSSPSAIKKPSPVSIASVAIQPYEMVGALTGPPMAVPLLPIRRTPPPAALATLVPKKRPFPVATPVAAESPDIRRNYSSVAAAAAAAATTSDEEEDDDDEVEEYYSDPRGKRDHEDPVGLRSLATAIESFAGVYARVEAEKQRQIVELEKQRMQFVKELECQRMQMLVEMQVQLQKVKRVRR